MPKEAAEKLCDPYDHHNDKQPYDNQNQVFHRTQLPLIYMKNAAGCPPANGRDLRENQPTMHGRTVLTAAAAVQQNPYSVVNRGSYNAGSAPKALHRIYSGREDKA